MMQIVETKKVGKMSGVNLKKLEYSPEKNPLLAPELVPIKTKQVRSAVEHKTLTDAETGELVGASYIHQIEKVDSQHFVKVFSGGIAASYDLSRTAHKVFMAILEVYEQSPMQKGYVDSIYLAWFDGGLSGQKIGMSEKTFQRGLKELLTKEFLSPKAPNLFWVNPALFFKGDRAVFIKEYRKNIKPEPKTREKTEQEILEERGQMRLDEPKQETMTPEEIADLLDGMLEEPEKNNK